MCLFSRNSNFKTAVKPTLFKNPNLIDKFDCGVCPECLAKKARLWSLRCSAEAQYNRGIMVTLTYDDYLYSNGRIIGEKTPNKELKCSVRHCQLFIKRLRKHFNGVKIKYLLTAEHGKRTNRAHYHAILFGVDFKDRVPYKKSKRGNMIYKSKTLTDLWSHGICTIDAVNITGQIARYCTKYCAKDSRCDDTFMLMSRGIGDKWLLENFNGKSYILDGREYPIPKLIWNKYIQHKIDKGFNDKRTYIVDNIRYPIPQIAVNRFVRKYSYEPWFTEGFEPFLRERYALRKNPYLRYLDDKSISYRYKSCAWLYDKFEIQIAEYLWRLSKYSRQMFNKIKFNNPLYQAYLKYWRDKGEIFDMNRPDDLDRIKALPDDKYFFYKQKAIRAKLQEVIFGRCIIPRSGKKSLTKFSNWKYICPAPLVTKGQMTPKKAHKYYKGVFWSKNLQDFIYLRPVKD